ncbi:MAG: hypothetical protein RLZZ458_2954 [Planctomycetota bacterium]
MNLRRERGASVVLVLSATVLVLVLETIADATTHFYPRTTRCLSIHDRLRGVLISDREIAEGNGKQSLKDKNRSSEIARGSALECAPIHDVLRVCDAIDDEPMDAEKGNLKRIVSMLTRLIQRATGVSEDRIEYEYRDAEYEYDHGNQL